MRIDVKKFLFIGLEEERQVFFKKAQEAGVLHFIQTKGPSKDLPADINHLTAAIKVLRGLPTMRQEELEAFGLADDLVEKILSLKHSIEKLYEDLRTTRLEIARVGIFGDFSKEDLEFIEKNGYRHIQFYFAKHGIFKESTLPPTLLFVGSDHELDYFVGVNQEPRQYKHLVEMQVDQPVGLLRRHYGQVEKEIHEAEYRLKQYEKYNHFLHQALIEKLNHYHLQAADFDATDLLEGSLFVIEAWIPINKIAQVEHLVHEMRVQMSEVAIEPSDHVPTYMENEGMSRIGEDVINIYDIPSTSDKDPSLWVLLSFALFFAFIVGDAGYGAIFLISALYLRYKFSGAKGAKRRLITLATILGISTLSWGLLTNSLFGISFSPDSPIRTVSLLNRLVEKKTAYIIQHKDATYDYWVTRFPQLRGVVDPKEFIMKAATEKNGRVTYELMNKFSDNIMMELALFIGVVHTLISMLRYLKRNRTFFGWIPFLIGGYLYIPYYLQATSLIYFVFGLDPVKGAESGIDLMIGGLIIATLFSFKIYKLKGILEPMTAIQIFSDVMSYLRLYALGLAGAMVTATLNESLLAFNVVIAGALIFVGHLINMSLSIMGGVIHGLRLNFLEWYHWSFEGGGKAFKPLHKIQIE